MATSLCEGKTSLFDISSALLLTSEGHTKRNDIDYTTDRFASFHEEHAPLDIQRSHDKEKGLRSHLLKKSSCLLTADAASLSFEHLLNRFGHLKLQQLGGAVQDHKPITASNVNYHILSKVTGIRIVWVESLSLHLEFDRRTMTLKLFQESKTTVFDSLFQSQQDDFVSNNSKAQHTTPYSQDFFVEVLCSYRLLFGQQKNARELYLKHFRASTFWQADHEVDPLRDRICGTPSHRNALFNQIDAFPEKSTYWSDFDFPSLGERLLETQDFVVSQDSATFRALWYGMRDLNRFWTFWAVLGFGVFSTVLSIIQPILTGLQLRG